MSEEKMDTSSDKISSPLETTRSNGDSYFVLIHWIAWPIGEETQWLCSAIDPRTADSLNKTIDNSCIKKTPLDGENTNILYIDDTIPVSYSWNDLLNMYEYHPAEADGILLTINHTDGILSEPEKLKGVHYADGGAEFIKLIDTTDSKIMLHNFDNVAMKYTTKAKIRHVIALNCGLLYLDYKSNKSFNTPQKWLDRLEFIDSELTFKNNGGLNLNSTIEFWPPFNIYKTFINKCNYAKLDICKRFMLPSVTYSVKQEHLKAGRELCASEITLLVEELKKNPQYAQGISKIYIKGGIGDRGNQVKQFNLKQPSWKANIVRFIKKQTKEVTGQTEFLIQPEVKELLENEFKLLYIRGALRYIIVTKGKPIRRGAVLNVNICDEFLQPESKYIKTIIEFGEKVIYALEPEYHFAENNLILRLDCGIRETYYDNKSIGDDGRHLLPIYTPFINEITTGLDTGLFTELIENPHMIILLIAQTIVKHFLYPETLGTIKVPWICPQCNAKLISRSGIHKHKNKHNVTTATIAGSEESSSGDIIASTTIDNNSVVYELRSRSVRDVDAV